MMEVDPSNFIPNTGVSYNDPREDQSDTPDVIKAIKEVHHNGQYSSDHYSIENGDLQIEPGLDYKDYLLPGNPAIDKYSNYGYGYMDFTEYCKALGVDPSEISAGVSSDSITIGDYSHGLCVNIKADHIDYMLNGKRLFTVDFKYNIYARTKNQKDCICFCVQIDKEDTDKWEEQQIGYRFGLITKFDENWIGAIEVLIRNFVAGNKNDPFS